MVGLYWQIQTLDEKRNVVEEKAAISRSFVKNFLQLLYRQMRQASQAVTDVDNTSRTAVQGYIILRSLSHIGQSYLELGNVIGYRNGIVVGTGTTTVAIADYKLATVITHGTSSGQLEYCGCIVSPVVVSGPDTYFDIERIFRNSSGGPITVKELGLQVASGTAAATSYTFLIIRDVLVSGDWITVTSGQYLRVVYRIKITT